MHFTAVRLETCQQMPSAAPAGAAAAKPVLRGAFATFCSQALQHWCWNCAERSTIAIVQHWCCLLKIGMKPLSDVPQTSQLLDRQQIGQGAGEGICKCPAT